MDSKKNSSSSLTAELFGFKESPPKSSTGIFASIFPPPSQVCKFFYCNHIYEYHCSAELASVKKLLLVESLYL